jgi:uncharacterized radical SAM superfamily protein
MNTIKKKANLSHSTMTDQADIHTLLEQILHAYIKGRFTWADGRHLLKITDENELEWFFTQVGNHRFRSEPKILKCYTPGQHFPAISVTGTDCELNCAHCDRKYLRNMLQAPTEEQMKGVLEQLVKQGSIGALLSGGCDKSGRVPVLKYKDIIDKFTDKHHFYFNAHVGLVTFRDALDLKMMGIKTVSFDMVLDPHISLELFHVTDDPTDYLASYENLREAKLDVVPHVLIGGYYGKIAREIDALKILEPDSPRLIVFISMIPPKDKDGNILSPFEAPTPGDVAKHIFITKAMIPGAEISLGCMRIRGKESFQMERWAILAGANRIEIPHRDTRSWAIAMGFELQYFGSCCAVLPEFEEHARSQDITGKKRQNKDQ